MEEKIKKNWQEARFYYESTDRIDCAAMLRRTTALQRLAKRYNRFSNLAMVCILWCPFFAFSKTIEVEHEWLRISLAIYSALYFMVCSLMDRWLYLGIKKIDCSTMTVGEVLKLTLFYRKRHLQFMVILLPLAFIFIGGMVWLGTKDPYFVGGIFIGIVAGLAIGIRQFMEFMSDYRDIKN